MEEAYRRLYELNMAGRTTKSKKQVGFLLSKKVSPLTPKERAKLKRELKSGKVKVRK